MATHNPSTPPRRDSSPAPPTLVPSPFTGSTPSSTLTKTLSTLYLAGFSFSKIHALLPAIFPSSPLISQPLYTLSSLPSTCLMIQHRDRSNPRSNPYLSLVASCPSPLHTRRLANDVFEKHFPTEAEQATEKDELAEMRVWHARWKEEVRLCRESEFSDFNDRATKFEKVLNNVERWLVKENVPSSGWGSLIGSGLRTPESSSPKRSRPTTPIPGADSEHLKPQQLPKLDTRAMAAAMGANSRGRREGTATPGRAQMLDPEGFFSPRPKTPSPTPSLRNRKGSSAASSISTAGGSAASGRRVT